MGGPSFLEFLGGIVVAVAAGLLFMIAVAVGAIGVIALLKVLDKMADELFGEEW